MNMEYLLKSTIAIFVLAFQLGLVFSAPIHIRRHVPNASSHPEDIPDVEPVNILRSSGLDDLTPPKEPIKILRSTDSDVIIQISRSPGSYLKNETIRLQITNGEVISKKGDSVYSSKEGSVMWSKESDAVSSKERSFEVRSVQDDLTLTSGQSVEEFSVKLDPVTKKLVPYALVTDAKKSKKGKKKVGEKETGRKVNVTVDEKGVKGRSKKVVSSNLDDASVDGNAAMSIETMAYEVPSPKLQSVLLPKLPQAKSNLNQISKQKFENNRDGAPRSIRQGLLLKEIEINGMAHKNFGVFDEELNVTNKKIVPRRADLRLKDTQLLDNVINSAVSSIANRKPSSLLQRQALRIPTINQLPQNSPPLLNLGQNNFIPPSLPTPNNQPPSLFNPLLRAERLETTFDGLDRLVNALSRIDYYISNSAKHVLTMLTHHHNTDYRMKRPEPEDEVDNDARYFRSAATAAAKKQSHEKLYFLHN